ncbi:DUF438 domain-containing protein [Roseimarinus sediminis]|uniref:DUF438 domain-containing protein n=1 Tax=Roseimarinus sediminis TaxID=1610899 RepID=UPI003D1B27EE
MSELITNHQHRFSELYDFSKSLIVHASSNAQQVEKYAHLIETVDAREVMQLIDQLLLDDVGFEQVKKNIGKLINIFYKSLNSRETIDPGEQHFLHYLLLENRSVKEIMQQIKRELKQVKGKPEAEFDQLKNLLKRLEAYELHYIKKENILFPYIEKTFSQYRCLQLMWSFHDDYRRLLKSILRMMEEKEVPRQSLYKALGDLFFVILPIIFREEKILFPVALEVIPKQGWDTMLGEASELGWCYIAPPQTASEHEPDDLEQTINGKVNLGTGALDVQQLILMLEHLPVDITFVDEKDEVAYFSGAKHRIFPRSKAIIGRKVQNCHPKESVHVVNEIVEAFRKGQESKADFWIQMRGKFIHIRYFALRDEAGNYRGTIEVSQDCTEIRGLEGEQRLLNWKKGS